MQGRGLPPAGGGADPLAGLFHGRRHRTAVFGPLRIEYDCAADDPAASAPDILRVHLLEDAPGTRSGRAPRRTADLLFDALHTLLEATHMDWEELLAAAPETR